MWTTARENYETACRTNAAALPVFFQPWWLDAACGPDHWLPMRTAGVSPQLWPLHWKSRWGFRYATMPVLTPRLGFWPAGTPDPDALEDWMRHTRRFWFAVQHLQADSGTPDFWEKAGFATRPRHFYVLPERASEDAAFQSMNTLARREITRGERLFRLEESSDAALLHALMSRRLKGKGLSSPVSQPHLQRMVQAASERGQGSVYQAVDAQGRRHAALWFVWDFRYTYYIAGGLDDRIAQSGASRWLMWQAIRAAFAAGRGFDFCGGMSPAVGRMYASLGGVRMDYLRVERYRAPLTPGRVARLRGLRFGV